MVQAVTTKAAIRALQSGLAVRGVGLERFRPWYRRKERTRVAKLPVQSIERAGVGYNVTFTDGSSRVVLAGATFWVGEA